jgi:hypothetical protein
MFAKPENYLPERQDDGAKLLCSFPGCQKPWTVKIDRPMCSEHQWPKAQPRTAPASAWWNKDNQ